MGIIDAAKDMTKLAMEANRLDLHQKAVDLMGQVVELSADNLKLSQRVVELEKQLELKQKVRIDPKLHVLRIEGDDIPACVKCYEDAGKIIHLETVDSAYSGRTFYCNRCKWQGEVSGSSH